MWVTIKSNSLIDWKLQEKTVDLFFQNGSVKMLKNKLNANRGFTQTAMAPPNVIIPNW
jgi:hypothetical protein